MVELTAFKLTTLSDMSASQLWQRSCSANVNASALQLFLFASSESHRPQSQWTAQSGGARVFTWLSVTSAQNNTRGETGANERKHNRCYAFNYNTLDDKGSFWAHLPQCKITLFFPPLVSSLFQWYVAGKTNTWQINASSSFFFLEPWRIYIFLENSHGASLSNTVKRSIGNELKSSIYFLSEVKPEPVLLNITEIYRQELKKDLYSQFCSVILITMSCLQIPRMMV